MSSPLPATLFATPAADVRRRRRLLLVSYFYPPINVVGSLRWQRLSGFAAERGWAIDVILADPKTIPFAVDEARLRTLPPETRLFPVPDHRSWPNSAQRWLWRTIRPLVRRGSAPGAVASPAAVSSPRVPDRARPSAAYLSMLERGEQRRWARRAAAVGLGVARASRPDVVVSSGPPHSTHEAARRISATLGVPWIMDMRDPWRSTEVMPPELASRTWVEQAARDEARCVDAARLVTVTTDALRLELAHRYPQLGSRFLTVMNGADPLAVPSARPSSRFVIAYAGHLYVGRDPKNLFLALRRVIDELRLGAEDIGVEFMGGLEYGRKPITEIAGEAGVAAFVNARPLGSHDEAVKFQAGASMLVSLPQYAHLAIPAKVFEYVQYSAWLLILAERESATELLFRDTAADVVDPGDVAAISAAIRRRFEEHRRGERPCALNETGAFDRSRQARILLDALDAVVPVAM